MNTSAPGKIEAVLDQIRQMPGATYAEQLQAYADFVEARFRTLPSGEEWKDVMCLLGLLRGGLRRFERDFHLEYLPRP